jgi:TPR repeat protein
MKKRLILLAIVVLAGAGAAVFAATLPPHDDSATAHPSALPPPQDIPALTAKAEAGDAEAQFQLGAAFAKGQGITNSYAEAARWYQRAVDQGHAGA